MVQDASPPGVMLLLRELPRKDRMLVRAVTVCPSREALFAALLADLDSLR
jgi:hypothetical protein